MMRLRRRPFTDLVERQLRIFATEHGALLDACEEALRAYDTAPADEAEERYGRYADLADDARDALEGIREAYAATLDEERADAYREAFTAEARRRFPGIAAELE